EYEGEQRDGNDSVPGGIHEVMPFASESSSLAIFLAETPCDRASATSWRRRRRNRLAASRSAAGAGRGGPRGVAARAHSVRGRFPASPLRRGYDRRRLR